MTIPSQQRYLRYYEYTLSHGPVVAKQVRALHSSKLDAHFDYFARACPGGQVSIREIKLTGFVGFTKGRLRVAISRGEQKWESTLHAHSEKYTTASLIKDAAGAAAKHAPAEGEEDEPTELHAGPRLEDLGKGSSSRPCPPVVLSELWCAALASLFATCSIEGHRGLLLCHGSLSRMRQPPAAVASGCRCWHIFDPLWGWSAFR